MADATIKIGALEGDLIISESSLRASADKIKTNIENSLKGIKIGFDASSLKTDIESALKNIKVEADGSLLAQSIETHLANANHFYVRVQADAEALRDSITEALDGHSFHVGDIDLTVSPGSLLSVREQAEKILISSDFRIGVRADAETLLGSVNDILTGIDDAYVDVKANAEALRGSIMDAVADIGPIEVEVRAKAAPGQTPPTQPTPAQAHTAPTPAQQPAPVQLQKLNEQQRRPDSQGYSSASIGAAPQKDAVMERLLLDYAEKAGIQDSAPARQPKPETRQAIEPSSGKPLNPSELYAYNLERAKRGEISSHGSIGRLFPDEYEKAVPGAMSVDSFKESVKYPFDELVNYATLFRKLEKQKKKYIEKRAEADGLGIPENESIQWLKYADDFEEEKRDEYERLDTLYDSVAGYDAAYRWVKKDGSSMEFRAEDNWPNGFHQYRNGLRNRRRMNNYQGPYYGLYASDLGSFPGTFELSGYDANGVKQEYDIDALTKTAVEKLLRNVVYGSISDANGISDTHLGGYDEYQFERDSEARDWLASTYTDIMDYNEALYGSARAKKEYTEHPEFREATERYIQQTRDFYKDPARAAVVEQTASDLTELFTNKLKQADELERESGRLPFSYGTTPEEQFKLRQERLEKIRERAQSYEQYGSELDRNMLEGGIGEEQNVLNYLVQKKQLLEELREISDAYANLPYVDDFRDEMFSSANGALFSFSRDAVDEQINGLEQEIKERADFIERYQIKKETPQEERQSSHSETETIRDEAEAIGQKADAVEHLAEAERNLPALLPEVAQSTLEADEAEADAWKDADARQLELFGEQDYERYLSEQETRRRTRESERDATAQKEVDLFYREEDAKEQIQRELEGVADTQRTEQIISDISAISKGIQSIVDALDQLGGEESSLQGILNGVSSIAEGFQAFSETSSGLDEILPKLQELNETLTQISGTLSQMSESSGLTDQIDGLHENLQALLDTVGQASEMIQAMHAAGDEAADALEKRDQPEERQLDLFNEEDSEQIQRAMKETEEAQKALELASDFGGADETSGTTESLKEEIGSIKEAAEALLHLNSEDILSGIGEIGGTIQQISEVLNQLGASAQTFEEIREGVASLASMLSEADGDASNLDGILERLQEIISALTQIEQLIGSINQSEGLTDRLDGIGGNLGSLRETLEQINELLQEVYTVNDPDVNMPIHMSDELARFRDAMDSVNAGLSDMNERMESDHAVEDMSAHVSELVEQLQAAKEEMKNLRGTDIPQPEERPEPERADPEGAEPEAPPPSPPSPPTPPEEDGAKVEDMSAQMDALNEKVSLLTAALTAAEGQLNAVQQLTANEMAQMQQANEALRAELEARIEEVAALQDAANESQEDLESDNLEEIDEEISEREKALRRLEEIRQELVGLTVQNLSVTNQKDRALDVTTAQDDLSKLLAQNEAKIEELKKEAQELHDTLGTDDNLDALVGSDSRVLRAEARLAESRNASETTLKKLIDRMKEYRRELEQAGAPANTMNDLDDLIGKAEELNNAMSDPELDRLSDPHVDASKVRELLNEFMDLRSNAHDAGDEVETLGHKIMRVFTQKFGYGVLAILADQARSAIHQVYDNVVQLDSAMTELKKVTNETSAAYDDFLYTAADRAAALSTSMTDVISATASFARLGYSMADAATMADAAIVYSNVGDEIDSIDDAAQSVISTMTAFKVEAKDVMTIVDKFNAVGNNFAISSGGIGEAMSRAASSLKVAGNTVDESIALITAANTVVQNPESVGTAMKTISMYLRAAKTEAEEEGIETDGMAKSVSKLREELLALTGVDIQFDDENFKATYQILEEISEVWKDLDDITKANVLERLSGKRQANVTASILENFDIARRTLQTSLESEGSAAAEMEKYMDSIEGRMNKLSGTFQGFSSRLLNAGTVKTAIGAVQALVDVMNELNDRTNGVSSSIIDLGVGVAGLVAAVSTLAAIVNTIKVASPVTNLVTAITSGVKGGVTGTMGDISKLSSGLQGLAKGIQGTIAAISAKFLSLGSMAGPVIMGIIALVALLTVGLYKLYQAAHKTENLKKAAAETAEELQSVNAELNEIQARIAEINEQDSLSVTDEEELQRLNAENDALERRKAILEQLQAFQDEEAEKSAVQDITKNEERAGWYHDPKEGTISNLDFQIEALQKLEDQRDRLESSLSEALQVENPDSKQVQKLETELDKVDKKITQTKRNISSVQDKLDDTYGSLKGVTEEGKEKLDEYTEAMIRLGRALGGIDTEADTRSVFHMARYKKLRDELDKVADAGHITGKALKDIYDSEGDDGAMHQLLDDLSRIAGVAFNPTIEGLNELADALNNVKEDAEETEDAVESLGGMDADFHELLDGLVEAATLLQTATQEMKNDGQLSASTLSSIAQYNAELCDLVALYHLGLVTAETVFNRFKELYEQDEQAFFDEQMAKIMFSEQFYNECVKGNEEWVKAMGEGYTADFENWKQLESQKAELDNILREQLGDAWRQMFSTYSSALKYTAMVGRDARAGSAIHSMARQTGKSVEEIVNAANTSAVVSDELMSKAQAIDNLATTMSKSSYHVTLPNTSLKTSGGSGGSGGRGNNSGGGAEDTTDHWKEEAENHIKQAKHMLEMQRYTQEQYYNELLWIENYYYKNSEENRKKYADEIMDLDEQIFGGRLTILSDYVTDYEKASERLMKHDDLEGALAAYDKLKDRIEEERRWAEGNGYGEDTDFYQDVEEKFETMLDNRLNLLSDYASKAEKQVERSMSTGSLSKSVGLYHTVLYKIQDERKRAIEAGITDHDDYLLDLEELYRETIDKVVNLRKDALKSQLDLEEIGWREYIQKEKELFAEYYADETARSDEAREFRKQILDDEFTALKDEINDLEFYANSVNLGDAWNINAPIAAMEEGLERIKSALREVEQEFQKSGDTVQQYWELGVEQLKKITDARVNSLKRQLEMETITNEQYWASYQRLYDNYVEDQFADEEEIEAMEAELYASRLELLEEFYSDQEEHAEKYAGYGDIEKQAEVWEETLDEINGQIEQALEDGYRENSAYLKRLRSLHQEAAKQITDIMVNAYQEYASYMDNFDLWKNVTDFNKVTYLRSWQQKLKQNYDKGLYAGREQEFIQQWNDVAQQVSDTVKSSIEEVISAIIEMNDHEQEEYLKTLDEELDRYKELVALKKKLLEQTNDQIDHEMEVEDQVRKIAKLQAERNRVSLDDSREGKAKAAELDEQLYQERRTLYQLQKDWAVEKTNEALDEGEEETEKTIQKEKDEAEEALDTYMKKLHKALDMLETDMEGTFEQLMDYAAEFSTSIDGVDSVKTAVDNVRESIEQWGGALDDAEFKVQSLYNNIGMLNAIAPYTADVDEDGNVQLTGSELSENSKDIVDSRASTATANAQAKAESVTSIVNQMRSNGDQWNETNDAEKRTALHQKNGELAKQLEKFGVSAQFGTGKDDGWWVITGDRINPANVGRRLYEVYHKGGVAGREERPDESEVLALLKRGEMVLTEAQKENLMRYLSVQNTFLSARLSEETGRGDLYRTESAETFSPHIEVHITHNGEMGDADARRYGTLAADTALEHLREALYRRGKA